ncbi:MAG: hypothetical protein GX122_06120 [Candidatus Cloacimonetes bacterium]|nr:hypothetical protein [Candidatus Cloacimonadota bacterium]NLO11976.1 hypothetical protein [Candidatus Cloacimonadota bacterium]
MKTTKDPKGMSGSRGWRLVIILLIALMGSSLSALSLSYFAIDGASVKDGHKLGSLRVGFAYTTETKPVNLGWEVMSMFGARFEKQENALFGSVMTGPRLSFEYGIFESHISKVFGITPAWLMYPEEDRRTFGVLFSRGWDFGLGILLSDDESMYLDFHFYLNKFNPKLKSIGSVGIGLLFTDL